MQRDRVFTALREVTALATGQALLRLSAERPGMPYDAMLDQIRHDFPGLERARLLIAETSNADDTDSTPGAQLNHVRERPFAGASVGARTIVAFARANEAAE